MMRLNNSLWLVKETEDELAIIFIFTVAFAMCWSRVQDIVPMGEMWTTLAWPTQESRLSHLIDTPGSNSAFTGGHLYHLNPKTRLMALAAVQTIETSTTLSAKIGAGWVGVYWKIHPVSE